MAALSSCETPPTTGGGSNLEDSSKYHVTLPQDEKIEIKGIVSDGYEAGSTVTFTVTVKAENKIIKEVKAGEQVLVSSDGTNYSFVMPKSDVTLTVTLKGEDELEDGTYPVSVSESEDYTITGLKESYASGESVLFKVEMLNIDKVVDKVEVTGADVMKIDDSYSFVMPENAVSISVTTKAISSELSGQGTVTSPFIIDNHAKLLSLGEKVNSGELETEGKYFVLNADIDLVNREWTPIGTFTHPFMGHFVGNGHTIKGLKVSKTTEDFKLEDSNMTNNFAGLFGVTQGAFIQDFNIEKATVGFQYLKANSALYLGVVAALGINTTFRNVDVSIEKFDVVTIQNGDIANVVAGGLVGSLYALTELTTDGEQAIYLDLTKCSVKGDINIDTTNSNAALSVVGGLVGETYTENGTNVISLNNNFFEGNIVGGTYIGGIVGQLDVLTSVLDSYADGEKLVSEDTGGSYVGGIAGGSTYESAIMNTYASFNTLTAPESTDSYYSSYVGELVGYAYPEQVDIYGKTDGVGVINSYYDSGAALTGDNIFNEGIAVTSSEGLLKEKVGFSEEIWDLSGETPAIKDDGKIGKVDVTLDYNGYDKADEVLSVNGGTYDFTLPTKVEETEINRDGYSFNGFTYDEAGEEEFRWYIPVDSDTTLYAKFTDLSSLKGTYKFVCTYYENIMSEGYFKFDDEHFYWFTDRYEYFIYEYELDDDLIFVKDELPKEDGNIYGGYEGCTFILQEDGTIFGWDANSEDATYLATKTDETVEVPSFKDAPYLGTWYTDDATLNLYSDGLAVGRADGKTYDQSGGFGITSEGKTEIVIFGLLSDVFTYDDTNDILIGESGEFASREKISAHYVTNDESPINVYLTDSKTFVIVDGAIADYEVSGEFKDGATIVINGVNYLVDGATLVKEEVEEPDPEPVENTFVGTWTLKVGSNSGVTLIIYDDGTVDYDGTVLGYTSDGTSINIQNGDYTIDLKYDPETQTLTGQYNDLFEGYEHPIESISYEPFETIDEATFVGKWKVSNGSTLILKDDFTGQYGDTAITYTVEGNTITCVDERENFTLTLVYDSEAQTLEGTYEDYEGNVFDISCNGYEPLEDEETPSVSSFYGSWTGELNKLGETTFIFNSDGTGKYGDFTFEYTVTNNVITASFDANELTATFDPEKGTMEIEMWFDYSSDYSGVFTEFVPE